MMELKYTKLGSAFITLTYNEGNIKKINKQIIDKSTGELNNKEYGTLVKADITAFMKRLRRHYEYHNINKGEKIRYYGCGEYGETNTLRPHYHIILFNININDKKIHTTNFQNKNLYTSKTINKLWNKGHAIIGEVNTASVGYTARYTMKKTTKYYKEQIYLKNSKVDQVGRIKEYTFMSRRPGIGAEYYHQNKDRIYKNDEIFIINAKNQVIKTKPPRYFDRLLKKENEKLINEIKTKRRAKAQNALKITLEQYNGDYERYLKDIHIHALNKVKQTRRNTI